MYANEMIPRDVFHPCEILIDEMETQGINQSELATRSGFNKSLISLLMHGKRNITTSVAIALEKVLNIPSFKTNSLYPITI